MCEFYHRQGVTNRFYRVLMALFQENKPEINVFLNILEWKLLKSSFQSFHAHIFGLLFQYNSPTNMHQRCKLF